MILRNDADLPGHWLRIVPIDPHIPSEKYQKMPIYVSKIPIDAGAARAGETTRQEAEGYAR